MFSGRRFFWSLFGFRASVLSSFSVPMKDVPLTKLDSVRSLLGVVAGEFLPLYPNDGGMLSMCSDSIWEVCLLRLGDLSLEAGRGARRGLFFGDAVFAANAMDGLVSSVAAGVLVPLCSGEITTGVPIRLIVAVSPLFSRENCAFGRAGDRECCEGTVLLRCRPLLFVGIIPEGGVPGPGLGEATPECLDPLELTDAFLRMESSRAAL